MVNGVFLYRSGARDFRFQSDDAGVQFGNGQRPQILPQQAGQRIISLVRQIVIQVHDANVDPAGHSVNKGAGSVRRFLVRRNMVNDRGQ
ncbi:hypothetical protein SBA_ch1_20620 [Sphingomonas bisphenolicum]|uniref:Uncharacterized protein n=1 Tax=Sphingomonas bisphenolicum TaxID=296544 RepID=A0ABM7G4D9_9SPHN|nr:hypothetical protein SBA_ch1_20620 [Sphingomonas bisphenolicum]